MALLSSCWLIIVENILIPPGFQKWYSLSFFIHPFLIVLGQIFIWVQFLGGLIWTLLNLPLKHICSALSWMLSFIRESILSLVFRRGTNEAAPHVRSPIRSLVLIQYYRNEDVVGALKKELRNEEDEVVIEDGSSFRVDEDSETGKASFSLSESSSLLSCSELRITSGERESESLSFVFSSEFSVMHRQLESDSSSLASSSEFSVMDRQLESDSSSLASSSEFWIADGQLENRVEEEDAEVDEFYDEYKERMRWFDLVNHERAYGLRAISKEEVDSCSLVESGGDQVSQEARSLFIRCLESDFEMVYVGQTCLCWEALHHQYRKVEALVSSSTPITRAFYENVAGKFQQFQVLLQRFMENERTGGAERSWRYAQGRLSLNCLLQVPDVPGYVRRESEGRVGGSILTRELMKEIKTAITSFWKFMESDSRKAPGKLTGLVWINPQVEDPKDLHLFAHLRSALYKKELMRKNLNGRRRRCFLRRTKAVEESQQLEALFCSIDMKLVSRVLKMRVISTAQLRWCEEKLANIELKAGVVVRNESSCLFPPS